jgi:hypothetical protein
LKTTRYDFMKYILFLAAASLYFSATAQIVVSNNSDPFQVLYASGAKNKVGNDLKSLDPISIDENISVSPGGSLALIHYSGWPIEIKNDTTISIKALQDILEKPNEVKRKEGKTIYPMRPSIEKLFESTRMLRRAKSSMRYACNDCGSGFRLTYPPMIDRTVYFLDQLCVKWESPSTKYKIRITTMFDDFIDSLSIDKNEISFSGDDMKRLMGTEDVLLFKIDDIGRPMRNGTLLIRKFSFPGVEFPFPCEIKNALHALMAAYYFEMVAYDSLPTAEKYYKLATQLSDDEFFKKMLNNFLTAGNR